MLMMFSGFLSSLRPRQPAPEWVATAPKSAALIALHRQGPSRVSATSLTPLPTVAELLSFHLAMPCRTVRGFIAEVCISPPPAPLSLAIPCRDVQNRAIPNRAFSGGPSRRTLSRGRVPRPGDPCVSKTRKSSVVMSSAGLLSSRCIPEKTQGNSASAHDRGRRCDVGGSGLVAARMEHPWDEAECPTFSNSWQGLSGVGVCKVIEEDLHWGPGWLDRWRRHQRRNQRRRRRAVVASPRPFGSRVGGSQADRSQQN